MERPKVPVRHALTGAGDLRAWDRTASWVLAGLVLGMLLSLKWWSHGFFDPENDACMYIQVARNMLAGEGVTLLGEPFGVRPPGFSVLIAPLLWAWGTDVALLNLYVNLFGLVCVALLFIHSRVRLGTPIALALALWLWTNPGFRILCNQIMSDVPGMALALGCLVLERSWRGRRTPKAVWLGIAIGLAGLVRTMNLLLVPAILAAAALGRGGRRWSGPAALALVLGTVLVSAPWSLRNARAEFTTPAEQTFVHSYSAGMFHQDARDPTSPDVPLSEILSRAPQQLSGTVRALGSRFGAGELSTSAAWLGGFSLVCMVAVALRRREPAEFLNLGLLVVVALYFAFDDRLVLPLFVLGIPAVAEVFQSMLRRAGVGLRWVDGIVVAAVLCIGAFDMKWTPYVNTLEENAGSMRRLAERVEEHVPVGAAIGMRTGGELSVYLENRTIYSLHSVARPGHWRSLDPFLEERGIDYCVFFEPRRDFESLSTSGRRKKRRAEQMQAFLADSFEEIGRFEGWWIYVRR